MSFQDLHSSGQRHGHASKTQPKQRRDEESANERHIKANIQEMQESVRLASDQIERSHRTGLSKRMGESLDNALKRSHELVKETEQLFRDWEVQLAGEPAERHRKKFSLEKLQKVFREEISHLKEAGKKAIAAHQESQRDDRCLNLPASVECHSMCDDQGNSDEEKGLLDDSYQPPMTVIGQDLMMENRLATEREEGIRRIQGQVAEVNQIFKDLASIVSDQGQHFETIENQAEAASTNTKDTVRELKKAADRQRSQRERVCCLLAAAILVICFVLLPHLHT